MCHFSPVLDRNRLFNISGFTGNCYYCMVSALLNLTTAELGAHVGHMQRNSGGGFDEIIFLLQRGGYPDACYRAVNLSELKAQVEKMPIGAGLGLVYVHVTNRDMHWSSPKTISGPIYWIISKILLAAYSPTIRRRQVPSISFTPRRPTRNSRKLSILIGVNCFSTQEKSKFAFFQSSLNEFNRYKIRLRCVTCCDYFTLLSSMSNTSQFGDGST